MSTLTPSQKLLSILFRLLNNPLGLPVKAIMDEYELSDRTMRNYVRELRTMPDFYDKNAESMITVTKDGDTRYLRLRDGAAISETAVEAVLSLYMASSLMGFMSGTGVYQPLQKWVESLTRKGIKMPIRYLDKKIYSIAEFPKNYSAKDELLRKILSGIVNQRRLDVEYASPASAKAVRHPGFAAYTLLQYRFGLYILGVSETKGEKVIALALDRITHVKLKAGSFHYPSNFSPQEHFSGTFGIIKGEGKYPVELIFDSDSAYLVRERFIHKSAQLKEMKDGNLKLTMTVDALEQLVPWLLGFGDSVTVVRPTELRKIVVKIAKNVVASYREG